MKKVFYLLSALLLLSVTGLQAQVTIGSQADPHPGAVLELKSNSNRGLLLPIVTLTDAKVWLPIGGSSVDGMMVYNDNTSTSNSLQGKGVYVWIVDKWNSVTNGGTNDCTSAPAAPGAITLGATTVTLNSTFTASVAAVSGATSYTWALPLGLTGSSATNSITITAATAGSIAASGIKVAAVNACGTSATTSGSGTITVTPVSPCPSGSYTISNGVYTAPSSQYINVASGSGLSAFVTAGFQATNQALCLYKRDANGATMSWGNAVAGCNTSNTAYIDAADGGGLGYWRLPNIAELGNLQPQRPANTQLTYWSSTENTTEYAWVWYYLYSYGYNSTKTGTNYARCARSL